VKRISPPVRSSSSAATGIARAYVPGVFLWHRRKTPLEVDMTSSQTYLLGFIILIIGLAGAAYILAVPPVWIAVGVVILIGIGIMAAASYSGSGDG
jgi:heme A synthase